MIEMMLGSGSPIWTMPSMGLPYQPIVGSPRPLATPGFGSTIIPGGIAGGPTLPRGFSTPGLPSMYGGAPDPLVGLTGADANGFITASSLLTAVAMRRGQLQGPTNDQEVEEFIFDALELLPGASDVEVRCESGRATLTGSVHHKRTKRDVGEIAWAIPGLHDVQNNVLITSRRRGRAAGREADATANVSGRKQG
jgi:hypothetical protein